MEPTMQTTKIVRCVDVESHGVDHAQYFQGAGVSLTSYGDCATGIGNSEREALEDALDCLAQSGEWIFGKPGTDGVSEPDPLDYSDVDEITPIEDEARRDSLGERPTDPADTGERCSQCEATMINGVYCHETECPIMADCANWDSRNEHWNDHGSELHYYVTVRVGETPEEQAKCKPTSTLIPVTLPAVSLSFATVPTLTQTIQPIPR